jgi:hypothetical protein
LEGHQNIFTHILVILPLYLPVELVNEQSGCKAKMVPKVSELIYSSLLMSSVELQVFLEKSSIIDTGYNQIQNVAMNETDLVVNDSPINTIQRDNDVLKSIGRHVYFNAT